jgi:hypothetical protein
MYIIQSKVGQSIGELNVSISMIGLWHELRIMLALERFDLCICWFIGGPFIQCPSYAKCAKWGDIKRFQKYSEYDDIAGGQQSKPESVDI